MTSRTIRTLRTFPGLGLLTASVLVLGGCADDGADEAADTLAPVPTTTETPGDLPTAWSPAPPDAPVTEDEVRSTYDVVLDAVTDALADESPDLTWSGSTTRTEDFEGTCAVTLERRADGRVPADDTLDLGLLVAALAPAGFDAPAVADDPGGALRYLADGDADALFELRSKDTTATVAVRVPTTPDSCEG